MLEGRALLDLVLPRTCAVCRCKLALHEEHICCGCLSELPLTYFWKMPRNPMSERFNAAVEENLPADAPLEPYSCAAALFFYDEDTPYRNIPQRLKYHRAFSEGKYFAAMLGRYMSGETQFSGLDAVIPVPLHWSRRWRRGYNQAEVIARSLSSVLQVPVKAGLLRRVRRTSTQVRLSSRDKRTNVTGAFSARSGSLPLKHVLLVDDVFTTGATLHEAARALKKVYGTDVKISVATLAFVGD